MKIMRNFGKTKCYARDTVPFNPSYSLDFSEVNYTNMLKTADRIQCVNRIKWNRIPSAFTSLNAESMLYDKGAFCTFLNRGIFTLSPFTLKGKITKKGRLYKIQPITLDGKPFGDKRRVYTPDCNFDFDEDCCIIVQDYTGCIQSDNIIPRAYINESTTIADEVKVYKQLLYNIILSVKKLIVSGVSEEQKKIIIENTKALFDPSSPIITFRGDKFDDKYSVTQFVDRIDVDSFTRAISFYNKIRRNFNGVPAPDTFEKKERLITPEMEDVGKGTNLILFDALMNRQMAVNWINKAFNLDISVEINKQILGGASNGQLYSELENERFTTEL